MVRPEDLIYTKEHEWIHVEGKSARIGITDYAQDHLGGVVFVELPGLEAHIVKGDTLASLESVKAVAEVGMPLDGVVLEVNSALENAPELLNDSPYEAWIACVAPDGMPQQGDFMDAAAYQAYCGDL